MEKIETEARYDCSKMFDVMIDTAGAAFGIAVLLFIAAHVKRRAPVKV